MTSPRLAHVILRVSDMERATAFWGGVLGLPSLGGSETFAFFDAGATKVALNLVDGGDRAAAGSTTEVVLEVDDPRTVYAAWAERGVAFEVALRPVMEAGGRSLVAAHFRDPDGHLVSLTGWE